MPYILLTFGLLIGGYALYRFLRRASKDEARKVIISVAICFIIFLIFVTLIMGKVVISAILAAVLIPLVARLYSILSKDKS
jgi:hypothetical protein